VGDIFGSCSFNLLILAVLDYFVPGKPFSSVVTKSHVLAGFFGIFLITLSVISIVFGSRFPAIGWFSSYSILLNVLYLIAIRIIFKNEQHIAATIVGKDVPLVHHTHKDISLQLVIKRYALFALMVIAGASALPCIVLIMVDFIIEGIEEYTGVTIIYHKSEEIRQMITKQLGGGVTVYLGKHGFGAKGENKVPMDILYSVITRLDVSKLTAEIEKIDSDAFIIMSSIKDTRGGMIKKRRLKN